MGQFGTAGVRDSVRFRLRPAGNAARRPRIDRGRRDQLKTDRADAIEDPRSCRPQVRVDPEPELIDQAFPGEGVRQLSASGDDQVARMLLLECRDGLDHLAVDERGVPLQRPREGSRRDVLRHAVDPLRVVAHRRILAEVRPDDSKPFVGLATEQQRVGQDQLLEAGVAAVGVQLQPFLWRGRLEGAVHGDLIVNDDLSHTRDSRNESGPPASVE